MIMLQNVRPGIPETNTWTATIPVPPTFPRNGFKPSPSHPNQPSCPPTALQHK